MFTSIVPAFIRRRLRKKSAVIVQPIAGIRHLCRKDMYQRTALYCEEPIRQLCMRVTSPPIYATPSIPLEEFMSHILRHSSAPRIASYYAVAIAEWVTQDAKSPLSSSSPHHLFLASYQYTVQRLWGLHKDDEEWVTLVAGYVPENEIMAMKLEVAGVMKAKTQWMQDWEVFGCLRKQIIDGFLWESYLDPEKGY